ncbi:MAG TPA: dTMP kinase [Acidobacteriota bacterium]|nr:dTMP kinase [Acidobacteriota bacterium]
MVTKARTKRKATRVRRPRLFVTFEGVDGCGKSTQTARAARFLTAQGYRVRQLREPGATRVSERIRRILLDRRIEMSPITELLLYEAARAEIMACEIVPALQAGTIVLCDRFYDSTTAYQGYGRGLDIRMVTSLHRVAVGQIQPDLTLVFDLDLSAARARRTKKPDRLESQSGAFFRRVRRGFLEIARKESRRVKVVDASRSVDEVFDDVKHHLIRKLGRQ